MRKYSALLALFVALFTPTLVKAQEFNCQASVIAPQVATAQPRVFQSLELAIKEFYQNRRFTNLNYAPSERIDINILLTISSQPATDRFEGSLQIIYARPVFGSDYNSPVIDLVDNNVQFNFLENTQIEFTPQRFISNLSSLLGYYAYFILGVDGDTFAPLGGTDFYNQAQQIVNNAQNASESGWKAFEDQRNRYWLLDNQQQSVFRPLRELLYNYHRLGMDAMTEDAAATRKTIATEIEKLKTVHQAKPASYNLQVFFNAKYQEIVEVFKPAEPGEKSKLFNTLQIIDPGHISQYQNMMRGS
ncbi:MAG: DUF4835 family protein [Flavobacteriales bacterium]|nr:DUF4835 family protein [Flavobacteriales bacterium]MBK6945337.1 DUF4835 family protein [Flavobacteriales bacterium]MBK9535105.1 DUF4835 family protein [Flavobacteriales bacterium]MBP9139489.1 DUF4835 family protein [Flavobacteriales bacterium]HQV52953.1 DUF4835 family protein [Flavobacteriales bacterium]